MLSIFYWLLAIFLINLGIFIFVLTHERRSMWAGLTLTSTLMFLAFLAIDALIIIEAQFPQQHQIIANLLLLASVGVALFYFSIRIFFDLLFSLYGIKILIKEGTKWTKLFYR